MQHAFVLFLCCAKSLPRLPRPLRQIIFAYAQPDLIPAEEILFPVLPTQSNENFSKIRYYAEGCIYALYFNRPQVYRDRCIILSDYYGKYHLDQNFALSSAYIAYNVRDGWDLDFVFAHLPGPIPKIPLCWQKKYILHC